MSDEQPKPEAGSTPLDNQRWELFARAYATGVLTRGNATKAYKSAGYSVAADASAATNGEKLLRNADIKQRVTWLKEQMWKAMDMSAGEVAARTAAIARFDPAKLVNEGGDFLALHDIDEETRMALDGVEVQLFIPTATDANPAPITIATKKYKGAGKMAALRLLMQQKKMIGSDVAVTLNVSMADRLAAARKRNRERRED